VTATDKHPDHIMTGTGHAADAGTITTDTGKTVEHGELSYAEPPTSKYSSCDPNKQVFSVSGYTKPLKCTDYQKNKWDGFLLTRAEQDAKKDLYKPLIDFANNTKLAAHLWGKTLEQNKLLASDPNQKDYVFDIGFCTARLWSQNMVNNKIIFNKQITDYNDNNYEQCAKYDVLARSCLIGEKKINKKENGCYNYYASMAIRVGEFKNMEGRRMPTHEEYDDTSVSKPDQNGQVTRTRKGKYFRVSANKLQKQLDWKVKCMDRVIKAEACFYFRHMMPAALQAEVQEKTFLHKTEKKCPPCKPCKPCPKCPKCELCRCGRLTDWELEALHKVIYKGDITKKITTGINCDLSVFSGLTDKMVEEKKAGEELSLAIDSYRKIHGRVRARILAEEDEYYN